ncbi:uncharacterized protein EI90DRAFT_3158886 [Cantharellus anzutake]|uniref:uncharacterized protein n=1 Tax=Cantharellus anzutake TaxID=1750568 RepID=UPI00190412E5|nr:uncharacterized protein EI90DRAFT_3158886 [Cantharellus anzutake]KAF8316484.1 hypothetical protein EI90DRAFT_3158886 [Cantharellus anzutake]
MGRANQLMLLESVVRAGVITGTTFTVSRYIPKPLKWFAVFLVALNLRVFPIAWHIRILYPWFRMIWIDWLIRKRSGIAGLNKHLTKVTKEFGLGKSPLDVVEVLRLRAGIADCDYNLHLSNSSYAKNMDFVRMNAAIHSFPGFHSAGGRLALGGSYIHFLKEIPMFAQYEIRLYFGGWDTSKWLYLYAQYLTYPKKKDGKNAESRSASSSKAIDATSSNAEQAATELLKGVTPAPPPSDVGESVVIIHPDTTSAGTASSSAVPSGLVSPAPGSSNGGASTPSGTRIFIETPPVPEGAILHATGVSQYCFKFGRITVPPRVAYIVSGFGDTRRWERLQRVREGKEGKGKLSQLLSGGWKDTSEGDFWSFEEFEAEGLKRGAQMKLLKEVMEGLEAPN